jgi:hypothetical protein
MLRVKWEEMSEILCLPKMDAAKSLGMGHGQVSIRKKKWVGEGEGVTPVLLERACMAA